MQMKRAYAIVGTLILFTAIFKTSDVIAQERHFVDASNLPKWISALPLAKFATFYEVKRNRGKPIATDDMYPFRKVKLDQDPGKDEPQPPELYPEINKLDGTVSLELFDVESKRSFEAVVSRQELAKFSQAKDKAPYQSNPTSSPVLEKDIELDRTEKKAWSNGNDGRTRRAIADGHPTTSSIYQRIADYGGCSANVLSASSTRMVAITAAHCVFLPSGNWSNSRLAPRRDGNTQPWGTWSVYGVGYYGQFLDNDCQDDDWARPIACMPHDIAFVIASPDPGATPPMSMGWAARNKDFLGSDNLHKFRRGYPGCGFDHSPANCNANTLYGDWTMDVGRFRRQDSDGWNRRFRISTDINPGDSGSGLYYYSDGFPYVFGVAIAETWICDTGCIRSLVNFGRRITPNFYELINSIH